jgi:hypothetical protein
MHRQEFHVLKRAYSILMKIPLFARESTVVLFGRYALSACIIERLLGSESFSLEMICEQVVSECLSPM